MDECTETWEEIGSGGDTLFELKIRKFIRREMYDHSEDEILKAIMRGSHGTCNPKVVRQVIKEMTDEIV